MANTMVPADALEAAIAAAEAEYRKKVVELAMAEASKPSSSERELADVDDIHQARTRVIALHAARDELIACASEAAS